MYQADINTSKTFLKELLERNTTVQGIEWLTKKMDQLASEDAKDKDLYLAFSAAPRFVGKEKLRITEADLEQANTIRKGFNPSRWTADQAARTLLLLSLPAQDADAFAKKLETLFSTADMGELVALYGSLPLLPHPASFKKRAAEGVRTNMGDVYEAVALENPYPADYMEEEAWNQLLLKTLFVAKPLYRIYGIEARSNAELARMLTDYAHERWAAGRPVSPELWRPVGPYINETNIQDIEKLFSQPNEVEREAAALACAQSSYKPAKELLEAHPDLKQKVESGELNWSLIGSKALA
ncbi:EboA domain-containing protein [Pontibacter diazotrophicus]|uniref:EboA domain-containing protein n=1 Tax=Pontibacter diazotrophicus TaxID=1400979 RepID=UPI0011C071CA|nr:EboA domain-containing protein [Pontibacter diazotrophicus]